MRKLNVLLLLLFILTFTVMSVFADDAADVRAFFDKFVNAANTYQDNLPSFYASNAKIIRYVIQKDGTLYPDPLIVDTQDYMKQLRINGKLAKLRNYKNLYKDINIAKTGSDYKISANRTPSTSPNDKMPSYFIIGKDASGSYKIKEEMMQTREQIFINQIKKQQRQ